MISLFEKTRRLLTSPDHRPGEDFIGRFLKKLSFQELWDIEDGFQLINDSKGESDDPRTKQAIEVALALVIACRNSDEKFRFAVKQLVQWSQYLRLAIAFEILQRQLQPIFYRMDNLETKNANSFAQWTGSNSERKKILKKLERENS